MSKRLKALAEQFHAVRHLATTQGYSDELKQIVGRLQVGYGTVTTMFEPKLVFRARKLADGFVPQNIAELLHPPAINVPTFGRANLPFQPLLYCSDSEFVALKEVMANPGDRIGMIQLSLIRGKALPEVFTVGEMIHRHRTRRSLLRGSGRPDAFVQLRRLGVDLEQALLIDGFYADAFRNLGASLYPLTAAIAQSYLSPDQIVGLIYPSVAGPDGFNVVMKPEQALRYFEVDSVKIIRFEKRLGIKLKLVVEDVPQSISPDGSIVWLSKVGPAKEKG